MYTYNPKDSRAAICQPAGEVYWAMHPGIFWQCVHCLSDAIELFNVLIDKVKSTNVLTPLYFHAALKFH